jgi:hypothetical protein
MATGFCNDVCRAFALCFQPCANVRLRNALNKQFRFRFRFRLQPDVAERYFDRGTLSYDYAHSITEQYA